jgi:hypothetical protein
MTSPLKIVLTPTDIDALFDVDRGAFVAECYRKLLRREPDASGFEHYHKRLSAGYRRERVILDILLSKEAQRKVENARRLRYYVRFRSFFGIFASLFISEARKTTEELIKKVDALTVLISQTEETIVRGEYAGRAMQRKLHYAVRVRGGLGDAVIIARFLRDLQRGFDDSVSFDVYFHSPLLVKFVFESVPGFRQIHFEDSFTAVVSHYAFGLDCSQYVCFVEECINWRLIDANDAAAPLIHSMYRNVSKERKEIDLFLTNLPFLDGAFANRQVFKKLTRMRYLHAMCGITYGGDRLALSTPKLPDALQGKKYIVIHDGWDNAFELKSTRPTKAMPLKFWIDLVASIKRELSDVSVVQIGGSRGEDVDGVDYNFRCRAPFETAVSILKGARLLIDAEGGLVHYAAAVGLRAIVLFGPTNADWFGYEENVNVRPAACGNCWWSTRDWMDRCPAGYAPPVCTQHSASAVVTEVRQALRAASIPEGDARISERPLVRRE